jgi:hypothetical protein
LFGISTKPKPHAARCFQKHRIRYFVTGAVAAIAYGEPRLTNDIDIVVDLREDEIPKLKGCYPEGEFYFDEDSARRAVNSRSQFNIIHSEWERVWPRRPD